ncbi:MAG TPA: hypothetical protein VK174_05600 [Chitinophagales bacterium]|nr:hypothetical protein [Chitinophagales bacterium]
MAKQQKQTTKEEVKVAPKKELVLTPLLAEPLAKKIFFGAAIALFLLMVSVSHQYGISGDENFHRMYGHHIVDYYTSFGKDTTAATTNGPDSLMVFYGGFYDGTATVISKAMPSVDEWTVRHAWNSMFGWFAMFCAALVAVEIAGWQAGLITLILMAFSPRFFGESMNNPKDITMAAGYMITYVFILKFLKQLPKPTLKTAIGLGLSIGMAMGIRIGGLLLIPYLMLFYGLAMWALLGTKDVFDFSKFGQNIWPSFKFVLLASVLGYFVSLLFWPYGLVSPFSHPMEALNVAQKFPVQIKILFEGAHISSMEVPWHYIPKWLLISTPLFGLLGLVLSFGLVPVLRKEKKLLFLAFLYFTIVFPLGYVIYKKSVLYDTMRHFFFVYPSLIILTGLVFSYAINALSKNMKYAVIGLLLILIALPARFMFANHPNEYVYFNELVGGIKGAFGNYETDYYMNSVKQCADWMKENEKLKRTDGRKTTVYSNAISPTYFYFIHDTSYLATGYTSYRARNDKDADYEILYCRFVDRELLLNGCFPPEQSIHTVYADGVPLSCVIRKDDRGEALGINAIKNNDFETGIQILEPYCAKYPKNEATLTYLGLAYLQTAQRDPQRVNKGINVLNAALALNKENPNAIYYLSAAYDMIGDKAQAQYLRSLIQQ